MYTVLRFNELSGDEIQTLGLQLEGLLPYAFNGADNGVSDRVSIPLAEKDDWKEHVESIIAKLILVDALIANMKNNNAVIEIDIAIEPEDYDSLLSEFAFNNILLRLLVTHNITLKISIYGAT